MLLHPPEFWCPSTPHKRIYQETPCEHIIPPHCLKNKRVRHRGFGEEIQRSALRNANDDPVNGVRNFLEGVHLESVAVLICQGRYRNASEFGPSICREVGPGRLIIKVRSCCKHSNLNGRLRSKSFIRAGNFEGDLSALNGENGNVLQLLSLQLRVSDNDSALDALGFESKLIKAFVAMTGDNKSKTLGTGNLQQALELLSTHQSKKP